MLFVLDDEFSCRRHNRFGENRLFRDESGLGLYVVKNYYLRGKQLKLAQYLLC